MDKALYLLKCNCRLGKESAVGRCTGLQSDPGLPKNHALEKRGGAGGDGAGYDPDNVLWDCAASERHVDRIRHGQRSGHLEYPCYRSLVSPTQLWTAQKCALDVLSVAPPAMVTSLLMVTALLQW
jgi:hypothetical protein